jgi:hypothetical protein
MVATYEVLREEHGIFIQLIFQRVASSKYVTEFQDKGAYIV